MGGEQWENEQVLKRKKLNACMCLACRNSGLLQPSSRPQTCCKMAFGAVSLITVFSLPPTHASSNLLLQQLGRAACKKPVPTRCQMLL